MPAMRDSGLSALTAIAHFHRIPADPGRMRHLFGQPGSPFGPLEIIRAARSIGLKAKLTRCTGQSLPRRALPAIARSLKGDFFILAAVSHTPDSSDQRS